MTKLAALLAGIVTLLFLGLSWWLVQGQPGAAACGVATGSNSGIGGPFELIDGQGRKVTDATLLTEPALIYFGYSFCPDICPLDNARNAEAVDILEERGFAVTPVFITVDPERDTPEVMADYSAAMHPRMVGLTGTPAQIAAAERAYKVFAELPEDRSGDYLVAHSTVTYLMLPGNRLAGLFKREEAADGLAEKAACILSAGE